MLTFGLSLASADEAEVAGAAGGTLSTSVGRESIFRSSE
jgi:hypothetical protein